MIFMAVENSNLTFGGEKYSAVQEVNALCARLLSTYSSEEKHKGEEILNLIFRQLNEESIRGKLEWAQYTEVALSSMKALFKLIYLIHFNFRAENMAAELAKADIHFAAALNLQKMLLTRVLFGAERELILESIRATAASRFVVNK